MKTQISSSQIFACAACKNGLKAKPNTFFCGTCDQEYLIKGVIPDFISNEASENSNNLMKWANNNYNLQARIYEFSRYPWRYYLYGGIRAPNSKKINRMILDKIKFEEGLILDVACGPGTLGRPISSENRVVYGVDISMSMLEQGIIYTRNNPNMHFARAIVEELPFKDAQFDAAICGSALHFFNDTMIALKEIRRTLKLDAPLFVIAHLKSKLNIFRRNRNWLFHPRGTHLFTIPELEQTLDQAGFKNFDPKVYGSMVFFSAIKKADL